ncbi:substrate-binding periplasmic protein [Chitinilyticum aquatile]|uniref:substrate-binding periplasmic protein n=1 Tax=Chitinilyticum aquatile TaxID=362520 RepID=UPI0003F5065E|nr:transporter substrate-binding domain-containing protein [Chitinilyticum aquatile]
MFRLPALIALLFVACLARAAGPACPATPVSVGLYEFGVQFHDGKGIDRDVIEELGRRSGCKLDIRVMPRAQIWQDLASGALMISVSALYTPERARVVLYSPAYTQTKNVVILPRQIGQQVSGPAAFIANPAWRWGVVRSYRHGDEQDALIATLRAQGRVDEAQNIEELFAWLASGKIQGLFAQPVAYALYLNEQPVPGDFVARDWMPADRGVTGHLVFSRKHFNEREVADWSLLLMQIRHDGTLEQIYRRYLPQAEARRLLPRGD